MKCFLLDSRISNRNLEIGGIFFSLSLEEHTKPNISCYCTEFKADK